LVVALPNFLIGGAFLLVLFAYRRRVEQTTGGQTQAISANRSRKMVEFEMLNDHPPPLRSVTRPSALAIASGGTSPSISSNLPINKLQGDHLALWVVIFEFTLDLLPNLANFVLTFFDINVSVYLGAFRSISYSLCALCSILAHTALLWRVFSSSKFGLDWRAKFSFQPFSFNC
jgi:hypothetical protein